VFQTEQRENPTAFLADMIEKGMPHITETDICFLAPSSKKSGWCGCALGMAVVGQIGDAAEAHALLHSKVSEVGAVSAFVEILGIPWRLMSKVSYVHNFGSIAAEKIIDMLRAGYFDYFDEDA